MKYMQYQVNDLLEAIKFNTVETIPTGEQLTKEVTKIVEKANASGEKIKHYIGFEISGQIHIGTGLASALKIKKLQDAGVECSIYLADYHAWLNNKLDGKMETIQKVSKEYFQPIMKLCLEAVGADSNQVKFISGKELYYASKNNQSYWDYDIKVGKELTLNRVLKSITVMGKKEGEATQFAMLRYPVMQVADAFFMGTPIVHAGLDQRKCHVLMREIAYKVPSDIAITLNNQAISPIAIHHSLLLGMSAPKVSGENAKMDAVTEEDNKMSKSKPDSAIWVTDTLEEIQRKLKKAYCPMPQLDKQSPEQIETEQEFNPMLDWAKKLIFPSGRVLQIERPKEYGRNLTINNFNDLQKIYFEGNLHPMDLKNATANCLNEWFKPMQKWAQENASIIDYVKSVRK